jgi:hypothetical protein
MTNLVNDERKIEIRVKVSDDIMQIITNPENGIAE